MVEVVYETGLRRWSRKLDVSVRFQRDGDGWDTSAGVLFVELVSETGLRRRVGELDVSVRFPSECVFAVAHAAALLVYRLVGGLLS